MAGKGGATPNSGRKSKVEEDKVNFLMVNALKTFYKVDTDDKAKEKLIHALLETPRGQIFISEHLFGKPEQRIDLNNNISTEVPIDKWLS
jgi:hypothetical protein